LGVDELEEIYQLRRVLEADLAARSAPLYTAEQLELAESLCEELRLSAHGVGDTRPSDAHHRLHELLLQPAAGEQAGRILSRLWDVSDRYIALVYHVRPIGSAESYHRHTQLVSVAKKRKGPLMRDAVAEHLNESFSYMTVALKTILNPSPEPVEAGEGEQGAYPVVAT
jgi:DNA-binding GntR family transcriptional regulator